MSTIGPIEKRIQQYDTSLGRSYLSLDDQQLLYKSRPRNFWNPLPYGRSIFKVERASSLDDKYGVFLGNAISVQPLGFLGNLSAEERRCLQKAYGKLVGQVKEVQNGWGENLGQRKQTFEMMLLRISTLTQAARALKRGDIRGFLRALGQTRSRTRSRAKKASEIWLEYHFGWEPLYKDIYDGCKHLGQKLPWGIVSASSTEETHKRRGKSDQGYNGLQIGRGRVVAKLSGAYHASDPGGYLLNSLGVINPVSIAWELVPFSFAVDWFIPVGQYLQSLTDFVGVSRSREFTTVYKTAELYQMRDRYFDIKSKSVEMRRSMGISLPLPTFKLYRGFSVVRGATAIALLTGTLKSLG